MAKWLYTIKGLAISALCASMAWGQGFSVQGNKLTVETQSHWEAWDFPAGTVEISAGQVRPNFVRKNTDATQDILTHLLRKDDKARIEDVFEAGANRRDVAHLLDRGPGSEATYWEPRAGDSMRDWWFQLDLGRLVAADRIVLKFPEEEIGDPFLQFAVLTSDGDEGIKGVLGFKQVFRTQKNNKNQRIFAIDLEPTRVDREGDFSGDMIRYIQVIITESDTSRAERVSEARYDSLRAEGNHGAVDYYKKVTNGEVHISKDTWDFIDPSMRGLPRHYRRERPRLAALEVWSRGENIALGLKERKGVALDYAGKSVFVLLDGDFNTRQNMTAGELARTIYLDMKSTFWIDTFITFYKESHSVFANFEIQTSDGTLAPDGSLAWTTRASKLNRSSPRGVDAYDVSTFAESVRARYLQIVYWNNNWADSIPRELQFYGEGFQPEVELSSPGTISLGGSPRNLVSIEWEADTPPGTFVEVQTRTGNQLSEEYHYFNKAGVEVADEAAYNKLGFFNKGRIDTLLVAGSDWSGWSTPYTQSGAAITSPSPRSFLMMRARLITEDPLSGASLNAIRVNFVNPLADRILGEISPTTVDELGVEKPFSLFIKPLKQSQSFDEILLQAPSSMNLEFEQLRAGREAQWAALEPMGADALEILSTASDSLWLRLNEPLARGQADLIEVQFNTTLYTSGAAFLASLGQSSTPESWQRVDAADATELEPGQGMILLGSLNDQDVLSALETRPPLFTPNGDGINDEMVLAFTLKNLSGRQQVDVRIFDLAGRLVRHIGEERAQVSGQYEIAWGGEGDDGRLLPPGIYLLEVDANADDDAEVHNVTEHRVIQVIY